MRLIDCYIENFGGLSEYSISFDKELTVLMEANGFGKSTLAAFIKAMFYGFPRATKTLDKNERKLYTPWQGGKFGGNLSFEYEGVSFRIERSFGATPRQDTFSLYELDPFKQSDRFTENIGQELFKLDVESYEKSTYMAQSGGISSFATAGIQTKLGDLVEEADDIYNFDKAVAALRDKRIKYKTYKGQYGTVYEIKNEISNLQTKISEKPQIENDCEIFKKQYSELILKEKENEAALESVRKRITKASEIAVLENLSKQYKELEQEKEQLKLEMENLLSVYQKGIPTLEEIENSSPFSKRCGSLLLINHIITRFVYGIFFGLLPSCSHLVSYWIILLVVIAFLFIAKKYEWFRFFEFLVIRKPTKKQLTLAMQGISYYHKTETSLKKLKDDPAFAKYFVKHLNRDE